jgi:hypothetical protein
MHRVVAHVLNDDPFVAEVDEPLIRSTSTFEDGIHGDATANAHHHR